MSMRMEKINSEIQKNIAEVIRDEVQDPAVGFISITRVETTLDLQESKVYFSLLDDKKYQEVEKILETMKKVIRWSLGKRLTLKTLPDLRFIPDDTIKYSVDIYTKIEEVRKMDEKKNAQE